MQKIKLEAKDKKAIEDFIKEIQKEFPNHDVNVNNVNDFAICLEQKKNCKDCLGLKYCQNSENGHYTAFVGNGFVSVPCKYKKENEAKNHSLIKTLYLPSEVLNATLENFEANTDSRKKIYKHIVETIGNKKEDFYKGLYLYGTFSIGKTYNLAVIANELSKNNIKSLLIYFPDLVLDLKNAMGTPRFEELVNMLKSIDVLMLDDVGSENITPWVRDEILGPVINYRMMAELPMYISSNLNPADLTKHLSIDNSPQGVLKAKRIVSRMTSLLSPIDMDDSKRYKR